MIALLLNRGYKRAITSRLNGTDPHAPVPNGGRAQQLLLMAMFAVMGKIAKMDGRVTTNEVKYASTIMQLMGLSAIERARRAFFTAEIHRIVELCPKYCFRLNTLLILGLH